MKPKLILNATSRVTALGLVLATAVISSCSTGIRNTSAATTDAPDPLVDFTGLWKGKCKRNINCSHRSQSCIVSWIRNAASLHLDNAFVSGH